MDDKRIEKDDCVSVRIELNYLCRKAKVLYVPYAVGESWVFEDFDDHRIHYISEGCTITLIQKAFNKEK